MKKENKTKKEKNNKAENKSSKLIKNFKKKWLISRTSMLLLIAILIAAFVLINLVVKYFDFTPIDCTTSQDYTLTDESKQRVAGVDKEVNIYFVGWDETNQDYLLAKQYNKANSKINVELVDATENVELASKYDLTSDSQSIIVESEETSRTLSAYDLVTYDENYNTISIAEQKITSAILNVTSGEIPKAYFLTGYTSFSFEYTGGLSGFVQYLEDEVLEYEELNILNTQKVPDDCDTLIIMKPEKDFDEVTSDAIIDYIEQGGNILWFNGIYPEKLELKNVNKVLKKFAIKEFDQGLIYETNSNNTIMGYPTCFVPEILDTDVTKNITKNLGAIFLYPTKININEEDLEERKVEKTELITSSSTTYFTKDITGATAQKDDEQGGFVLGAKMVKTIEKDNEEITSTLIIYGNDYFISDQALSDNSGNNYSLIGLANNADLGLNSIAYLTNRDQDITIRKSYSDSVTSFTPTDGEKSTIMKIIFIVPIAIMLLGLIIWIRRKNKK